MANGRDLHLDLGAAAKGTWSRPRFWPNGRAKGAMETLLRCIYRWSKSRGSAALQGAEASDTDIKRQLSKLEECVVGRHRASGGNLDNAFTCQGVRMLVNVFPDWHAEEGTSSWFSRRCCLFGLCNWSPGLQSLLLLVFQLLFFLSSFIAGDRSNEWRSPGLGSKTCERSCRSVTRLVLNCDSFPKRDHERHAAPFAVSRPATCARHHTMEQISAESKESIATPCAQVAHPRKRSASCRLRRDQSFTSNAGW